MVADGKVSMTDLAKRHFMSPNCVQRILQTLETAMVNHCLTLPYHLCFDEFKSVKRVEGAMNFIYTDGSKREIVDLLHNRRLEALRKHFSRYSLTAGKAVKTIVVGMNAPYFTIIEELFPRAKTIVDPFHLVQVINRSLNKTRIIIMNGLKKDPKRDQKDYTKLKRYWKLFLKERNTLNYDTFYYRPLFKKELTTSEVVD